MADQSDENRLAPLFDPKLSPEVSGDEAESSVPRGPKATQARLGDLGLPHPQAGSLTLASEDEPIPPDPSNEPLTKAQVAASERQDGFIAYFSRPTGGSIRMEQYRPSLADITISDGGIEAMNEQWSPKEQWVEPAIRWIHLPGNNPDWVRVRCIFHKVVWANEPGCYVPYTR
jgi:hypothetical protein